MPYPFSLTLRGIIALVRREVDGQLVGYEAMVLETRDRDSSDWEHQGLAGLKESCPHTPVLRLGDLPPMVLGGHRIRFLFDDPPTGFNWQSGADQPPRMHTVVGNTLAKVKPELYTGTGLAGLLTIDKGTLGSVSNNANSELCTLGSAGTGPFKVDTRILPSSLVWSLTTSSSSLTVEIVPFDHAKPSGLVTFRPGPDGFQASLTNDCPCDESLPIPADDEDFLWYYTMFADPNGLNTLRDNRHLPVPVFQGAEGASGCSTNCVTCEFEA